MKASLNCLVQGKKYRDGTFAKNTVKYGGGSILVWGYFPGIWWVI